MSAFWWIVVTAILAEVGTLAVMFWWETIRDLLRPLPPEADED